MLFACVGLRGAITISPAGGGLSSNTIYQMIIDYAVNPTNGITATQATNIALYVVSISTNWDTLLVTNLYASEASLSNLMVYASSSSNALILNNDPGDETDFIRGYQNGTLMFSINNGGGYTTYGGGDISGSGLIITNTAKISKDTGIGTNLPQARLHVTSDGTKTSILTLGTTASDPLFYFYTNGNTRLGALVDLVDYATVFYDAGDDELIFTNKFHTTSFKLSDKFYTDNISSTNLTLTGSGTNVLGNATIVSNSIHLASSGTVNPIGYYGALMMNATNIVVCAGAAGVYTNVAGTGFTTIVTNGFYGGTAANSAALTNLMGGWYKVNINLSFVGQNNQACEGEVFTNGVSCDLIGWKKTFDAAARLDAVSASGIIFLPAGTRTDFRIQDAGTGGSISIHRASLVIGTP